MMLLIDNYDSFTYNFVRMAEEAGASDLRVVRNDQLSLIELQRLCPQALIISPGPGRPQSAGVSVPAVARLAGRCPILGICLGHQCIIEAFGGSLRPAGRLMHGKTRAVHHAGAGLFSGLPSPLRAARYHSLAADPASLPAVLQVVARAEDGEIMAVEHRTAAIWGVQFHPESFLTESGPILVANFLRQAELTNRPRAIPPG
jgi:anthranilate synthase/aminodeoxychorismate synthase-like glutamine amidotransferase